MRSVLAASLLVTGAVGAAVAVTANASAGITIQVAPGQSLDAALAAAHPGDVVLLGVGTFPSETIQNRDFGGVEIRGSSRNSSILQGLYLKNVQHLKVHNLTVATLPSSALSAIRVTYSSAFDTFDYVTVLPAGNAAGAGFDIARYGGEPTPSHDITISNSLYDGSASRGVTGRGLRVYAGDVPSSQWPYNITLLNSRLRFSSADLIQLGGARNVTIEGNYLGKPQVNSDHDDGLQAYGSDNLVMRNNWITAPGSYAGNDQGIILGQSYGGRTNLKVTNSLLEGNVVTHWRGQGIMLAGTTNTVVRNNTVTQLDGAGSAFVDSPGDWNDTNINAQIYNNIFDKYLQIDHTLPTVFDYNIIGNTAVSNIGPHSYRMSPLRVFSSTSTYNVKPTSVAVKGHAVGGESQHIGAR